MTRYVPLSSAIKSMNALTSGGELTSVSSGRVA